MADLNTLDANIDCPVIDDNVTCWMLDQGAPPLFICAAADRLQDKPAFFAWVREHQDQLDALLMRFGALVFRGFPLVTADDFDEFAALYPPYAKGYVGGASPRAKVTGKVMEATRLAPQFKISLHQEMAYLKTYPPRIAFFCLTPAESGGETIIASMREFTRRLPESIRARLEEHGVRGVRNYGPAGQSHGGMAKHIDDKGWDEGFNTSDKAEVEKICLDMGMEPNWNADGSLTVVTYTDAFTAHPITGENFYRNILHSNYVGYENFAQDNKALEDARVHQKFNTGYALGNGVPLTREESRVLENNLDDLTVAWDWQAGDVMLLDNLQIAHGRNPFKGPRETLVALLN